METHTQTKQNKLFLVSIDYRNIYRYCKEKQFLMVNIFKLLDNRDLRSMGVTEDR